MKSITLRAQAEAGISRSAGRQGVIALLLLGLAGCAPPDAPEQPTLSARGEALLLAALRPALPWDTVANNATLIPGASGKTFSSYNQPSVNASGYVVFRARSTGSESGGEGTEALVLAPSAQTGPVRGLFARDLGSSLSPGPVVTVAVSGQVTPQPNNLNAPFNEFPSIPRIDAFSRTIATRAQSRPVWEYPLDLLTTTRVGTSGVYANPGGALQTGASQLGAVREYDAASASLSGLRFPEFQVPGTLPGTRFDQFPGAPGLAGPSTIVFKGNWTDQTDPAAPVGRTGVYYRDLSAPTNPTQRIADSTTLIPGTATPFGSTAPPSGAPGFMVFVGLDDEENPTRGGVYRAPLSPNPSLQPIATIDGLVPNTRGRATLEHFTRFGEGLSFDGRYVAFWGAWGKATRTVELNCQTDGNAAVITWCWEHSPAGDGRYTVNVPVSQGLFVHDSLKGKTRLVVETGPNFQDFLFWTYSGRPPGTGGGDGEDSLEPPRWRSSAFAAVNSSGNSKYRLAFKARGADGTQGLYLVASSENPAREFLVLADTRTSAWALDPGAPPADSTGTLPLTITSLGLERDSFRGDEDQDGISYLTINASMANADGTVSWAGVYLARLPHDE